MKTDELREKYLSFFQSKGALTATKRRAGANLGSVGSVYARRDEPVQGSLSRQSETGVYPRNDLPEVLTDRRHR